MSGSNRSASIVGKQSVVVACGIAAMQTMNHQCGAGCVLCCFAMFVDIWISEGRDERRTKAVPVLRE